MVLVEFRIHGRGGQGAKSAAQFLAEAALLKGKYIQAFPEYGPERSGAPVASFVRISDEKIITHQPVVSPDYVAVIDESMFGLSLIYSGITSKTTIVLNSSKTVSELKSAIPTISSFKGKVYTVPATEIAIKHIGSDKSNTAILTALVFYSKVVDFEDLKSIVYSYFTKKSPAIASKNIDVMEEVWKNLNEYHS